MAASEHHQHAARERAAEFLLRRHRYRWPEALPWLIAIACFFSFPERMTFGSQVLIMVMFALSLDLILGYAGIVTLGHAAFFGIGAYTVGLLIARVGWSEPISSLVAAAALAALIGFISGWFLLRYRGLTLLMLTLATAIMLQETGNLRSDISGGYDGLPGLTISPLFGISTTTSMATSIISTCWACWRSCSISCAASSIRRSARRSPASARMCGACTRSARRCTAGW